MQELAEWLLDQQGIEGITLSGGEPMEQAVAIVQLIDIVRERRDTGVVCYTGCTYEHLLADGTADQRKLLERVDLLIDGPYVQELHRPLLWRASANQRLLVLSPRYEQIASALIAAGDKPAGMEFQVTRDGLAFAGVPPEPRMLSQFTAELKSRGVEWSTKGD